MLTQMGYVSIFIEVYGYKRRSTLVDGYISFMNPEKQVRTLANIMDVIDSMTFAELNELEIKHKEKNNARWRQNKIARKNGQGQTSHPP